MLACLLAALPNLQQLDLAQAIGTVHEGDEGEFAELWQSICSLQQLHSLSVGRRVIQEGLHPYSALQDSPQDPPQLPRSLAALQVPGGFESESWDLELLMQHVPRHCHVAFASPERYDTPYIRPWNAAAALAHPGGISNVLRTADPFIGEAVELKVGGAGVMG